MATVQKTIEVDQPVTTVYNQWTQFESFPEFMRGIEDVRQLDDKTLHWKADIGFVTREWDAEITEQVPDRTIAWRSIGDVRNDGRVSFQPVVGDRTRVIVRLDYDPHGFMEKAGDKLNIVDQRVEGDLKRFKEFIEGRGPETGAWRGEIR
ncbi:MAG: SRPBCC family protein [Egibacteraceae bacterium]